MELGGGRHRRKRRKAAGEEGVMLAAEVDEEAVTKHGHGSIYARPRYQHHDATDSAGVPWIDGWVPKKARPPCMAAAVQGLSIAKQTLPPHLYRKFLTAMKEIGNQMLSSADRDGETTCIRTMVMKICKYCNADPDGETFMEAIMQMVQGHADFNKAFQLFTQYRNALDYGRRVEACIGSEEFDSFIKALKESREEFSLDDHVMSWVEDVFHKAKGFLENCPELLDKFKTYLPLLDEQSYRSPKARRVIKVILSSTPDANHRLGVVPIKETNGINKLTRLEGPHDQNHDNRGHIMKTHLNPTEKGDAESLPPPGDLPKEDKEDKVELLPDQNPSIEKELTPQVDLSIRAPRAPRYCLRPNKSQRATLQSSYQTELGRSVLNNVPTPRRSGKKFKCRHLNQHEELILGCEDRMFEHGVLLKRLKATDKFFGGLLDRAGSAATVEGHLPPLHRRCIEQLYGVHGLEMLDCLMETHGTISCAALAVIRPRIKQKIEAFSEERPELVKECGDIIANYHYQSLDHS